MERKDIEECSNKTDALPCDVRYSKDGTELGAEFSLRVNMFAKNVDYRGVHDGIHVINKHGSFSTSGALQDLEQLLFGLFQNILGCLARSASYLI
jgi:hypothetical protein